MKSKIPVAIVVPYRNRAALLPRTLNSLHALTYRPLQILLVDDGSTDDSCEICQIFKQRTDEDDFRTMLLRTKGEGVCRARNVGLAACNAPWVYFFDSDDEATPSYVDEVMGLLARDAKDGRPLPDIVACATVMYFPDGRKKVRDTLQTASVVDQILCGHMATHGMFFNTGALRAAGGWNEKLAKWNDWELGVRMLWSGAAVQWMSGQKFHRIHQHPDSITGTGFAPTRHALRDAICEVERLLTQGSNFATPSKVTLHSPSASAWRKGWRNTDNDAASLLALACRSAILYGKLAREVSSEVAAEVLGQAKDVANRIAPQTLSDMTVWVVSGYSRRIGTGAWRVALALSKAVTPFLRICKS